jgi:hypothetical protein
MLLKHRLQHLFGVGIDGTEDAREWSGWLTDFLVEPKATLAGVRQRKQAKPPRANRIPLFSHNVQEYTLWLPIPAGIVAKVRV